MQVSAGEKNRVGAGGGQGGGVEMGWPERLGSGRDPSEGLQDQRQQVMGTPSHCGDTGWRVERVVTQPWSPHRMCEKS